VLLVSLGGRIWLRAPRCRPAASVVIFIVGADHRLVLVVIRTLMIRELRQDRGGADRVAPARTEVKVLAQTGEIVFRRGREPRKRRTSKRLLRGETTRRVGIERTMNEVLCCGVPEPNGTEGDSHPR